MFTQAPCRASPDFSVHSKPLLLTIDFSKVAVGAVLSQEQYRKERFLGVKGRKCIVYETNYLQRTSSMELLLDRMDISYHRSQRTLMSYQFMDIL